MYAFVDRPVTCLDRGCRFLLWSMRSWVLVAASRQCAAACLAPAFAKWRMTGALQPFLRSMILLQRDSLQPLGIRSLRCGRISEHEAVLLALFTMLARGENTDSRDTLALIIGEDALGDALGAFGAVARALADAGMTPADPVIP